MYFVNIKAAGGFFGPLAVFVPNNCTGGFSPPQGAFWDLARSLPSPSPRKNIHQGGLNLSKLKPIRTLASALVLTLSLSFTAPSLAALPETIWQEKTATPVAKGVTYDHISRFTVDGWFNIHVLTVDLTDPTVQITGLRSSQGLSTLAPLSQMAAAKGAVAAVNADFFTQGAPLGVVIENGKLESNPFYKGNMAAFAMTADKVPLLTYFTTKAYVMLPSGQTVSIGNINKPSTSFNGVFLYTPAWGQETPAAIKGKTGITQVVVKANQVVQVITARKTAPIPVDGYVLVAGQDYAALFQNINSGQTITLNFSSTPDFTRLQTAVGGGALLVKEGKIVPFTHEITGQHPRTALGITADKQKLLLVVVDGRQDDSRGMTQRELADLMLELGAYEAINFDGGGSAELVARLPGDTIASVQNQPSDGAERPIATGVGVISTAPAGSLSGLTLKTVSATIPLNGSRTFTLSGYDQNYHPVSVDMKKVSWTTSSNIRMISPGVFKGLTPGPGAITARIGSVKTTLPVFVTDKAFRLTVSPAATNVAVNATLPLTVTMEDVNGFSAPLEARDLQWEVKNGIGKMANGVFTAGDQTASGAVYARFGGLKGAALIGVGETKRGLTYFDFGGNFYFDKYPASVNGEATLNPIPEFTKSNYYSARLAYDFTKTKEIPKAAYLTFNGNGLAIPQGAQTLGLWVYGDGNGLTLKATLRGSDGQDTAIELAKSVNWQGWQYVEAKLPANAAFLRRVYIVADDSQDPETGEIYLDDITAKIVPALDQKLALPVPARTVPALKREKLTSRDTVYEIKPDLSIIQTVNKKEKQLDFSKTGVSSDTKIVWVHAPKMLAGATPVAGWNNLLHSIKNAKSSRLIVIADYTVLKQPQDKAFLLNKLSEWRNAKPGREAWLLTPGTAAYAVQSGVRQFHLGTFAIRDGKMYIVE